MRKTKNIEFMKNQVLSIEQMKHLRELGVDTSKASMYWARTAHGVRMNDESKGKWFLSLQKDFMSCGFISYETVPTFTLGDMLEMMPAHFYYCNGDSTEISLEPIKYGCKYGLGLIRVYKGYMVEYADFNDDAHLTNETGKTALEAAYNMLCWLAENKLLRKEE